MVTLEIKLDDVAVRERINKLRADLADRKKLHHEMGLAVETEVAEHLRGLPGRKFYKKAAESVQLASNADARLCFYLSG